MRLLPVIMLLTLLLCVSCEEERRYYVPNVGDSDTVPTMSTLDVNTFISDSGYTKYFIKAPLWNMYDEAAEPYWKFPQGVELEQYNKLQKTEATLRCDSAIYKNQKRIWQLDGNIVMVNVNRDTFLTNQVFWDQARRKIYSDSFVHIVRSDRIIEGYGFESNEQMSAYEVKRPTGIFPVQNNKGQGTTTPSAQTESGYDDDIRRSPAPGRPSQRPDNRGLLMLPSQPSYNIPQ
ncbi:MAG: LPS export ABC transporter periplasmic protein LptC [Muribaculaceae bacterium]|nr:LPS export ABC transporter periplasmic protein LptC [Muribaculaceae bacterium]